MEDDFWNNVFFECDVKDVLNFRLICKSSKIKIDDGHFWKRIMYRDFIDIRKSDEETWLSYYKRRNINYGIPVIIDKKEKFINIENINEMLYRGSYKCICGVLNNNILKCLYNPVNTEVYILSTEHKVYSFNNSKREDSRLCQLKGFDNIKNIEISLCCLFFIDDKNNLYRCNGLLKYKLLDNDIINVFRAYSNNIALYYTKKYGTYSISDNGDDKIIKVFDRPVTSWLKLGNYDFYITRTCRFMGRYSYGEKYGYHDFKIKAKQLSYINSKYFAILGTDGLIRIMNNEDKIFEMDIPNVDSLSEDTFLTKNGDLYYFDENLKINETNQKPLKTVLMDTDVVNLGNFFSNKAYGSYGCYVKRYI